MLYDLGYMHLATKIALVVLMVILNTNNKNVNSETNNMVCFDETVVKNNDDNGEDSIVTADIVITRFSFVNEASQTSCTT